MEVNKNENVRPFDVDGCLIVNYEGHGDVVNIQDPINPGAVVKMRVNKAMVRLLIEEKQRGSFVRVWSRSGWEWARNVVYAIGIEQYVDSVESKPTVYFDNEPIQNWLKDMVFIGPDTKYKE